MGLILHLIMTLQLNSSNTKYYGPLVVGDVNLNPYYSSGASVSYTWTGELMTNGGFEWGNLTGWNSSAAYWQTGSHPTNSNIFTPQAGSYCTYYDNSGGGSSINNYIQQDVNLTSYSSYIDAGIAVVNASGWIVSAETADDSGRIQIFFLDSSKNIISTSLDTDYNLYSSWTQYGISTYYIPVGTRYIRMWGNTYETPWDAGSLDSFSVKLGYESGADTTAPVITLNTSVPSNTTSTSNPVLLAANISDRFG